MRAYLISTVIAGFFLTSFGAYAQVSIQSFSWQDNSRFDLKFTENGRSVGIKGELSNGAQQAFTVKDRSLTVQLKSYTTELFVVMTVTHEDNDMGYVFLFERPQTVWMAMNQVPIRASKLEIMENIQTVMKDFATVSNFTLANSMRKTVEYFVKNPNNRLEDLLNALETKDAFLQEIPKPRGNLDRVNQGVRPGRVPKNAPLAEEEQPPGEDQRGGRNAPIERRASPSSGYIPPPLYDPRRESPWVDGPAVPYDGGYDGGFSSAPVPVPSPMRRVPRTDRGDRLRRYDIPNAPPPDVDDDEFGNNEWGRRRRPPANQYRQTAPPSRPQRWQQYAPAPMHDGRREPSERGGGSFLDDYFEE